MAQSIAHSQRFSFRAGSVVKFVFTRAAIMRQRRALANLDDAMLRDLGLTREEAMREATRPVWDVAPKACC